MNLSEKLKSNNKHELEKTLSELEGLRTKLDMQQLAFKLALNSFYGMTANQYSRWFNIDIAEAITMSGQLAVRWAVKTINDYMNTVCKTENKSYVIAGDTDSVGPNSIIEVNGKKVSISDFFDQSVGINIKEDNWNGDYVKELTEYYETNSFSDSINTNKIIYIMKHKVKKRLYKIILKNKELIVTDDHSLIVKCKNTNKVIQIKPSELNREKHFLINISGDTDKVEENV